MRRRHPDADADCYCNSRTDCDSDKRTDCDADRCPHGNADSRTDCHACSDLNAGDG